MAIDFPASPTNGQTFTSGSVTYTYDGTKWTALASGGSSQWTTSGSNIYYNTGSVGIGTNPGSTLHVNGAANNTAITLSVGGTVTGYIGPTGFLNGGSDSNLGFRVESGGSHVFMTGATERGRWDSSGRFLVGTSTASTADSSANPLLQVVGRVVAKADATYSSTAAYGFAFRNSTNLYNMVWGGYDNTADLGFIQATYEGTAHKPFVVNPNGGEVRIGGITDQGAYNLQCQGTGVWGAGAYVNGSDERLKENIQDLGPALDVVRSLRPVTFQYKEEYSRDRSVQPGFIAQELQQAMADQTYLEGIVQAGPVHLNVAYQGLIAVLVKAVQELEAKVAALEGV